MATQYSPLLTLALPVQGELTGTWGDVINDEITSMVEQAIAGRVTINTWTSNSHTLTVVQGSASESRAAILNLTDSGTALDGAATLICPTSSKVYIVENNTAQAVTVKTASGTGISVPTLKIALIFCDGTNVENGLTYLPYSNDTSGLTATDIQSALDEIDGDLDTAEAAIITNADAITAAEADIITNADAITAAEADIITNADAITAAEADIITNADAITAAETGITNVTTVVPQTGGGELTALRVNELRDGNTGYTLPLADSVSANQTITITLPDEFKDDEPVVTRAGSDTISYSNGTDTSITFDALSSISITLTSDGTSDWGL